MLCRAERRVDAEVRVVAGQGVVEDRQVVRRDVGRDALPGPGLRVPHQVHRARRREVGEVQTTAGEPGERQVAGHDDLFRFRRDTREAQQGRGVTFVHLPALGEVGVLGVLEDDHAEGSGVLQGEPHHARGLDAVPVVGEDPDPRLGHLADVRERLTLQPARDRPGRVHLAQAGLVGERPDLGDHGHVVGHRVRVRHGAEGGEPPGGGGPRSRLDGLLVLGSGLAEVGVEVHQAGGHDQATRVDDLGPGLDGDLGVHRRHDPVLDQHVGDGVVAADRVHQPHPAEQHAARHRGPPRAPPRSPAGWPGRSPGPGRPAGPPPRPPGSRRLRASGTAATSARRCRSSPGR